MNSAAVVPAQVKQRASNAETTVQQMKLVRKIDKARQAQTRLAIKKGFAFVELIAPSMRCALHQLTTQAHCAGHRFR